jgi:hypothetical protein
MNKLASDILKFKHENKNADAAVILANGIGNSESEVDFIIAQLELFGYLERLNV